MNIVIFFTLFLIIIFISIIINNILKKKEHFSENNTSPIFLNENDLFVILKMDNDDYYKSFFKNDFITRNISTVDDYVNLIKQSLSNFNEFQKEKLLKCIKKVNNIFKDIDLEWFNGKKANNLQWKFGCIKGELYENGLPHTRNDIIIISVNNVNKYSENKLINTLIHEKIHIYQKAYPDDIEKYIINNNFIKFKKRDKYDNIRANPDLDKWIYKDNNNNIYQAVYMNNPKTIEDIKYYPVDTQKYEHPYEKMAIEMEKYNNKIDTI